MEEFEYLQPGKFKGGVAQLRNILLQNDIEYPSNSKKIDLINLFNQHIKPNAHQRLAILNNVVPNDDNIEVIEDKKSHKKKKLKSNEIKDQLEVGTQSPRKTSNRLSKSKDDQKKNLSTKRSVSVEIGEIPNLNVKIPTDEIEDKEEESLIKREKSPIRRSTRRNKTEEIPQDDRERKRERSPTRKELIVGESKEIKRERSPTKRSPSKKREVKSNEIINEEKKILKKKSESPFKVKVKQNIDSSFSNDNVFQNKSNQNSPNSIKTIPKKRSSKESNDSNDSSESNIGKKFPKNQILKKTAFSSSPELKIKKHSPLKSSLSISKFENSSPPSQSLDYDNGDNNDNNNNNNNNDLFNLDNNDSRDVSFNFEKALDNSPLKKKNKSNLIKEPNPTPYNQQKQQQQQILSDESNSKIDVDNDIDTPSKTRSSIIPDISKFKVSTNFAKTLGILPQNEIKIEERGKDQDSEFLQDSDSDQEDDIFQEELNETPIDSDLINLQKEIEDANHNILDEAERVNKEINEIFNQQEEEIDDDKDQLELKEDSISKPRWINFTKILKLIQNLIFFGLFVSITITALWYREQRVLIGYCGTEIDQPTFINTDNNILIQFNEILDQYKPQCLECPENAICLPNLQIRCKQDYIVKEPWYKLYGLLPLSNYCIKDTERDKIINEVVSKTLELLRIRNANYKCGEGNNEEDLDKIGITDEELYEFFFRTKNSSISDSEFNEIWEKVLIDLSNELEITLQYRSFNDSRSTNDNISSNEIEKETNIHQKIIFRSNSTSKLSISCKFQKEIYDQFAKFKIYIISFSAIVVILISIYFKILNYLSKQSKINEINEIIKNKLIKQQKFSIQDPTGLTNRYLSSIHLRDEFLSNFKNNEKFKIWDIILKKLESNSNIRSSTKEIHGEIVRVLEWIGE
ncbi:hypothetical protein WICMUC_000369 [Wickerhamomyces mucosus]|uniref:Inner nuclear membrane protein SRC1 n=1 Tax=Wickerhamomyces mucosus TaxID=1378264 RepID=A0A9P8PY27_9ASCO|nr:hypothetical protein WICMUC_000369 [Wickerhamomyces mucosus]